MSDSIDEASRRVLRKSCALVWLSRSSVLLALVVPHLMWLAPAPPSGVSSVEWLQYSGAVMVVFVLLAQVPVLLLQELILPPGFSSTELTAAVTRYGRVPFRMALTAIALSATGTLLTSLAPALA